MIVFRGRRDEGRQYSLVDEIEQNEGRFTGPTILIWLVEILLLLLLQHLLGCNAHLRIDLE